MPLRLLATLRRIVAIIGAQAGLRNKEILSTSIFIAVASMIYFVIKK